MKTTPLTGLLLALLAAGSVRAQNIELSQQFPNPTAAHTLRVNAGRNQVKILGADVTGIRAVSSRPPAPTAARTDNVRILSPATGISLSLESPNVALLDAGIKRAADPSVAAGVITVTVPRNTSVVVIGVIDSTVTISDITGDVEVRAAAGKVTLERLHGGAVVETNRGDIDASFAEVTASKPLSFSSVSGAVTLRVPEQARASIRLKTQNGTIATTFDETALVVRTESLPAMPDETVAGRDSQAVALQRPNAPPLSAADVKSKREAAARGAPAAANRAGKAAAPIGNNFSFTGGIALSGALNGGGPEISITTLTGDVTLRKL